jgi:hypothetical protein
MKTKQPALKDVALAVFVFLIIFNFYSLPTLFEGSWPRTITTAQTAFTRNNNTEWTLLAAWLGSLSSGL